MERTGHVTKERRVSGGKGQDAATPPLDGVVRSLMSDTDAGVLLLDPEGRVSAINAAGTRLLSIGSARARGCRATELLRSVVAGDDLVRDALLEPHTERETRLVGPDGSDVPVLFHSYRLGRPAWLLITLHDLTQQLRMQAELRRNERLATLGQLSAGVAHEIRNPLAGIGTSAQVLIKRFEDGDDRVRFVRVILDEVERLDRIVTSLLQYARPRTPELQPGNLIECVEHVLELSKEPRERQSIRVTRDFAERLGRVWIDADLVKQVLLNVTLNAIQAMPDGGTLGYEIRTVKRGVPPRGRGRRAGDGSRRAGDRDGAGAERRRGPSGPGRIAYQQIRVSDTGSGMTPEVLKKLFDPFYSTKPQGTGLGLSISQTIMQEHGGLIEVASHPGRGTTVLLSFPLEKRHGERRSPGADR